MKYLIIFIFITSSLIASDKDLFVGIENTNNCPYICFNEGSVPSGEFITLFSKFLKDENQKFQYTSLPPKRLYKNFFNNTVDFKFPDNPEWNMDEKKKYDITYIGPVFTITETLLSYKENFEEKVVNVGIIRGYTFNNMASRLKEKKIIIHEFNNEASLLESLRKGRVQIIQSNNLISNNNEFVTLHSQTVHYYISTINHKQFLNRFKAYIQPNNLD